MSTKSALKKKTFETKSKKSSNSSSSRGSKRHDTCSYHRCGKLDQFCVDHQCLICGLCRKEDHECCSSVIPVNQAAYEFSKTDSVSNLDKDLRKLLAQCTSIVDERQKDQDKLKQSKAEIELYVKNYRQSLIHNIDKVVQNILTEVGRIFSEENEKICNNILDLTKNVKSIEDKLADIEIAKTVAVDLPLFLTVQNALQKHHAVKSNLTNIHDEAHKVSLKLRKSDVPFTSLTIGEVEVEKKPYDILPRPVSRTTPALKEKDIIIGGESRIKLVGNFNTSLPDEGKPCITGMCTFSNNFILLADNNNNNVKLVSPKFQLVTSLPLLYPPFDVAVISDTSIAVTSPEIKEILLINVEERKILNHNGSVKLSHDCYGIDILHSNFVVTCLYEKCVKAIDTNGKEKWTVKVDSHGEPLFIWPWYVAVNKTANLVYVSDRNQNTITEIQSSGIYLRTITMSDSGPRGIKVDGKDSLVVCCFLKDSIVKVSSGLFEEQSSIGTKRDGMKHPQCVAFFSDQPRFILSSYKSEGLAVYELIK